MSKEHILRSDVHVIESAKGLRLVDPLELWLWRWRDLFAAMVPWQMFSRAMLEGNMSLTSNRSLVTKAYFPRILMPAAAVFGSAVDFAITFVILLVMMMWFGFFPSWQIVLTPVLLLLALLTSLGVALWFSAVNVLYRDVQSLLPSLTQVWLFLMPVLYPASVIPEQWRVLYAMNPMVTVTESFRWVMLGGGTGEQPDRISRDDMAVWFPGPVEPTALGRAVLQFLSRMYREAGHSKSGRTSN